MSLSDKVLYRYAAVSMLGAFVTAILLMTDNRMLLGESVWLKPLKFWISTAIVAASLPWVLSCLEIEVKKRFDRFAVLIVVGLSIEMVAIVTQAARGVRSHFNSTSAFDIAVYATMGIVILLVWLACVWLTWLLFQTRKADSDVQGRNKLRAAKWGMILFLMGAATGQLMTQPNSEQLRIASQGAKTDFGAHLIGSKDGEGSKIPVTGWSAEVGDIRVPHFIGMHALQVMMLLWWIALRKRMSVKTFQRASLAGGAGCLLLFSSSLTQALSAKSIVTLDSGFAVLHVFGMLFVVAAFAVAIFYSNKEVSFA